MCRSIRTLFNMAPPATDEEIRAASLQFVRKVSGFTRPSQVNLQAFDQAVADIAEVVGDLLDGLQTRAEPRDRDVEREKARLRAARRYGRPAGS